MLFEQAKGGVAPAGSTCAKSLMSSGCSLRWNSKKKEKQSKGKVINGTFIQRRKDVMPHEEIVLYEELELAQPK